MDEILNENFLHPLTIEEQENNRKRILYRYSDKNFAEKWNSVFKD